MAAEAEADEAGAGDGAVHRLVDMVVEEVSLVDRAANQRRFLIVKRRSEMADEGAPEGQAPGKDQAAGGAAAEGASAPVTVDVIGAMTEALSALTELVTTTSAEKVFPPRKPPKEGEGAGDDDEDDDPDKEDEGAAAQRRKAGETVTALLGQVKAALARLQTAVTAPAQKRALAADPMVVRLEAISAALGKIDERLKEQDGRLGKVEKNVGLPASRQPAGRGRGEAEDDGEVSWPMDLNAPMDREHVDKSVSFHDAAGTQ